MKYEKEQLEQTFDKAQATYKKIEKKFRFWEKIAKVTRFSIHGFIMRKLRKSYYDALGASENLDEIKKRLNEVNAKIRKAHEKRERKSRA